MSSSKSKFLRQALKVAREAPKENIAATIIVSARSAVWLRRIASRLRGGADPAEAADVLEQVADRLENPVTSLRRDWGIK